MEKEGPESGQINDVDRTRRRLLKLALWIPPAILTITSRKAWAANTAQAVAGASFKVAEIGRFLSGAEFLNLSLHEAL